LAEEDADAISDYLVLEVKDYHSYKIEELLDEGDLNDRYHVHPAQFSKFEFESLLDQQRTVINFMLLSAYAAPSQCRIFPRRSGSLSLD
jgi:hypothetical protein